MKVPEGPREKLTLYSLGSGCLGPGNDALYPYMAVLPVDSVRCVRGWFGLAGSTVGVLDAERDVYVEYPEVYLPLIALDEALDDIPTRARRFRNSPPMQRATRAHNALLRPAGFTPLSAHVVFRCLGWWYKRKKYGGVFL